MSTARTTATKTNGRDTYISGGAISQDGNLKLYTCNTCHRPVVWATSSRTGRKYLANVYEGASGARYYVKASAHQCAPPAETPEDLHLRVVKNQLATVEEMIDEADAGDTELGEKLRAKAGQLRQQIRAIEAPET